MLPNPAEILYFLEVASTLNISRAAERLGITQPTLSLAVQRLEATLGTPLLLRGKTGVRLTKAGSKFATQSRGTVSQFTVRPRPPPSILGHHEPNPGFRIRSVLGSRTGLEQREQSEPGRLGHGGRARAVGGG